MVPDSWYHHGIGISRECIGILQLQFSPASTNPPAGPVAVYLSCITTTSSISIVMVITVTISTIITLHSPHPPFISIIIALHSPHPSCISLIIKLHSPTPPFEPLICVGGEHFLLDPMMRFFTSNPSRGFPVLVYIERQSLDAVLFGLYVS